MRQGNHGRIVRQGAGKKGRKKGDRKKPRPPGNARRRERRQRRRRRKCCGGRGWRSGGLRAVARTRRTFLQAPDLCFGQLLPAGLVQEALMRSSLVFRDCFYTPLVTLWTFLCQVLCPDASCRAAVAHLLAHLAGQGQGGGTSDTGPYCKARERLPESLVADLARTTGANLQRRRPARATLLQGRSVKIADGTTLSMPDTPENQRAYPQPRSQKPGLGFPLLRLVAVMSLSCGAVLDIAIRRYRGKKTGETALLRQLFRQFQPGDVALADALFANYWTFAGLLKRGADVIARHDGKRLVDWRSGKRLGKKDHRVVWKKPARPPWMSRQQYRRLPAELVLRELAVEVCPPGFRARRIVVVTTLTDARLYPAAQIAAAYRARWQAELDLRAIKQVLSMEVLRCKTPEMVRKEIWMHLLAYNLIRTLLADAAQTVNLEPRELSFKAGLQTLNAFAPVWSFLAAAAANRTALYATILQALARQRVGDRPDRIEPRAVKRRPRPRTYLTEPRPLARKRLLTRS
jgi:hypothetical protein